MKLTNVLNLPSPLFRAIENDTYSGGKASDYTTTGLIAPARIRALMRQHRDELVEDASDRIWALFGQITHSIIERAATDEIVEKRLYMEVEGKTVSGQIDLFEGHTLWDFKTTTVYAGMDGVKEDWVQQGNINRLLCAENGIEIRAIQYVALYRDWSRRKAQHDHNYPPRQVEKFAIPMWTLEDARRFVADRIRVHESAKLRLPACTPAERWERPTKYGLMQKGRKRAIKLYDTQEQADAAMSNQPEAPGKKYSVEYRPGESVRCLNYCSVVSFCTFGRELLLQEEEKTKQNKKETNE